MINDLNDGELCEIWKKVKRNFELVNSEWPKGGNLILFYAAENMTNALTEFKTRLNDLRFKENKNG